MSKQELQLLSAKQELEQLLERWRTQAEAKGLHLTAPAGARAVLPAPCQTILTS